MKKPNAAIRDADAAIKVPVYLSRVSLLYHMYVMSDNSCMYHACTCYMFHVLVCFSICMWVIGLWTQLYVWIMLLHVRMECMSQFMLYNLMCSVGWFPTQQQLSTGFVMHCVLCSSVFCAGDMTFCVNVYVYMQVCVSWRSTYLTKMVSKEVLHFWNCVHARWSNPEHIKSLGELWDI